MRDWAAARAAHQDAAAAFVSRAGRVAADRWTQELAPGKWSPAEIAEHLSLTYQHLLEELRGGRRNGSRARAGRKARRNRVGGRDSITLSRNLVVELRRRF